MDVGRLLRDELVHELLIRGCQIPNNVNDMRVTLRDALRREQDDNLTIHALHESFNSDEELQICRNKINELRNAIAQFDRANRDNESQRISTRLHHVQCRLQRFNPEDGQQQELRNQLLTLSLQVTQDLNKAYLGLMPNTVNQELPTASIVNDTRQSILDQPIPDLQYEPNASCSSDPPIEQLIDHELSTEYQTQSAISRRVSFGNQTVQQIMVQPDLPYERTSTTQINYVPAVPETFNQYQSTTLPRLTCAQSSTSDGRYSSKPSIPVSKWNLHYDGESASLTSFLIRVEELRISRGFSKQQLLQSAVEIFSGDALHWYRAIRDKISSWDELVHNLKATFLPHDYESHLWDEIRNRTQHPSEKVAVYIAIMENLFRRLPHTPLEGTRIQIIRKNLQPYLTTQLALHSCYTLEELIRVCKTLEDAHIASKKFRPPSLSTHQLLEPDLGVRKHSSRQQVCTLQDDPFSLTVASYPETEQPVRSVETMPTSIPLATKSVPLATITCWNCRNEGHSARQCTAPKTKHCYHCGHPNVTIKTCPKCSGNDRRV